MTKKEVCIIGIGAIGSVVAKKLHAYSNLTLIDRDFVEESNLFRQPFYIKKDVGKSKAEAAANKLKGTIGKMMEVTSVTIKKLGKPDLIICCTDDIENKLLVNDYAKKEIIPLIIGSAIEDRGMIFINGESCFSCVFSSSSNEHCDLEGILPETSSKVGGIIAREAINLLAGKEKNELIYLNISGKRKKIEMFKPKKNEKCKACAGSYIHLIEKKEHVSRLCDGTYIIRGGFDFNGLKFDGIRYNNVLHYNGCTFFSDNRAFVKAKSEKEAIKKVRRIVDSS